MLSLNERCYWTKISRWELRKKRKGESLNLSLPFFFKDKLPFQVSSEKNW